MEQQLSDFYEDLSQLSDYLGEGSEKGWSHELKKQILLLLHKLKSQCRRLENIEVESELMSIEISLCYGVGGNNAINNSQVEDHQLRLMELAASTTVTSTDTSLETSVDQEGLTESEEESADCEVVDNDIDEPSVSISEIDISEKQETSPSIDDIIVGTESSVIEEVVVEEKKQASIQLILCNCPGRDAARELAQGLVKARFAACVNIIANIGAIYWWDGEIKDTAECQLQIKTSNQSLDDIIHYIKQNHPNEIPEIIAMQVEKGNQDYFDWVKQETYDRE